MRRIHRRSLRAPLWLFAAALLLRAAMPFLANASAEWQGRALAEVCSVHGVAIVAHDAERRDAPADPAAGHAGDHHCVLNALAALGATSASLPPFARSVVADVEPPSAGRTPARRDATANWVARRKQGPPALA